MPDDPGPTVAPPAKPRRRRVPSGRRFAAGALASFVAVFGVLALRVHNGEDPALAKVSATSTSSSSSTGAIDPYASGTSASSGSSSTSSDQSSSPDGSFSTVSPTPGASTSAS